MFNIQTHSENSIRSVRESSCIKACQNCYKHCYITMELLKSTVTLLNTCEKLKVMHETQCDLGKRAKANETCYCLCYCEHVKMRKRMRNGPDPRNEYGDKMRHFNEFFASFLRFYVFDLCFFVMKCNIIVLIIHNISYIYSYFSKVVTETIVNCAIWALKG